MFNFSHSHPILSTIIFPIAWLIVGFIVGSVATLADKKNAMLSSPADLGLAIAFWPIPLVAIPFFVFIRIIERYDLSLRRYYRWLKGLTEHKSTRIEA